MLEGLSFEQMRALPCRYFSAKAQHYGLGPDYIALAQARFPRQRHLGLVGGPRYVSWTRDRGFRALEHGGRVVVVRHDGDGYAVLSLVGGVLVLGDFEAFRTEMMFVKLGVR